MQNQNVLGSILFSFMGQTFLCTKPSKGFFRYYYKTSDKKISTYSDENNAYFLEFIRAESMESDSVPESLWFNELIEQNVLGRWAKTDQLKNMRRF